MLAAASLTKGASLGSQGARQGGGELLGQRRVQLGGHTLRRGLWAVGLRAWHLAVLPV